MKQIKNLKAQLQKHLRKEAEWYEIVQERPNQIKTEDRTNDRQKGYEEIGGMTRRWI